MLLDAMGMQNICVFVEQPLYWVVRISVDIHKNKE